MILPLVSEVMGDLQSGHTVFLHIPHEPDTGFECLEGQPSEVLAN